MALAATLLACHATATGVSRAAISDPAHTAQTIPTIQPGSFLASYDDLRTRLSALAALAVEPPAWADALGDVTAWAADRLRDAGASSRTWLAALAPLADPPPNLRALTAFPVPDHMTSGYGWRDDPIRHRPQFHGGADIHATRGTPVHAAGDGVIAFAGRQGGYGNVIYIDHGNGLITRYGHLSKILVQKGQDVTAAMEIGRVGSTGRATGPHLHFEVRIDGRPVNPELAMQVADLERTSPDMARLVGLALAPDVQSRWINDLDPPRNGRSHTDSDRAKHPHGVRPERRGRSPRRHDNS